MPLDHYDLILPSIQSNDFGSYRCIAFNGALVRQSSAALITEFHRPKISIRPSTARIDIQQGKPIDLQCHVESLNDDDQYEIEWHYEHKNGPILGRTNRLDISSIKFNQSGLYICLVNYQTGRKRHRFSQEIFVAVHDRLNNRLTSQSYMNVYIGRSAILNCQLPFDDNEKIRWSIMNRTDLTIENNHRLKYLDTNHYQLKISRIEEYDNDLLFECFYENQKQFSQARIQLSVQRLESPPILIFVPNNQTVPIGVEVSFPCQTKGKTKIQWWYISTNRLHKSIRIENSKKYYIESNHDLLIRHVEKNDAGIYKCIVTNSNDDETSWSAHLHVEDPRSNAIFQRVDRKDLPTAPTQPLAVAINSNSIELAWNSPLTDIHGYLIEYFNLNTDESNFEWKRFHTISSNSRQIIRDLKTSSTYQFLIRAKNSYGYGQPSLLSELIQTRNDDKLSNELVHLLEPMQIQQTSITIQWEIRQLNSYIDRYLISIKSQNNQQERIETILNKNNLTTYTIENLQANTEYSIRITTNSFTRPSNTISVRTLESLPSAAPTDVNVELTSITSLSIRWNPPLESEQNGKIIAYKVNCLGANESSSIRLANISSDAKGLHIKSLIENMQYCISVAARTRLGYGPYSHPICVTMSKRK